MTAITIARHYPAARSHGFSETSKGRLDEKFADPLFDKQVRRLIRTAILPSTV